MLSKLRTDNKVVGTKQAKRIVQKDEAELVYIAMDADIHVVNELEAICAERNVEVHHVDTMIELGKACGIDVGAAAAAILK